MASIGSYYITIMPDMSKFSNAIETGVKSASTTAGSTFSGGFLESVKNSALGVAIGNVLTSAATKAMDTLQSGIERVDVINNFPKVMQNLGYSSDEAEKAIERLNTALKGTPTKLDDALTGVQRIVTATGSVDKAVDVYLALNNALLASGSASNLTSSAFEQFTQALAKGKPDAIEVKSLIQAMPAQFDQLAKSMGLTTAELQSGLSDGTVSMDAFVDALINLNETGTGEFSSFSEQAQTSMNTIGGAQQRFENSWGEGWASIIDAVGEDNVIDALNTISDGVVNAGDAVADVITTTRKNDDLWAASMEELGSRMKTELNNWGTNFENMRDNVVSAVDKAKTEATKTWDNIKTNVSSTVDKIKTTVGNAWDKVKQDTSTKFEIAKTTIGDTWDNIKNTVGTAADNVKCAVGTAWENIKSDTSKKWDIAKTTIGDSWDKIKSTVSSAADKVKTTVGDAWDKVKSKTNTAFEAVKSTIQKDMDTGKQAATKAGSAIQSALSGDWNSAKKDATEAFNIIRNNISDKLDSAKQTAIDAADKIGEKFGFPGLGSKVERIFDDIGGFMEDPIGTAKKNIGDILQKIASWFTNFKIELPHISLPHFVISPAGWQLGDLLKGSIPSLSIEWYAKGGVIAPNNPHIIGVGDSHEREWIEPESKLLGLVESAVRNVNGGSAEVNVNVTVNADINGRMDAYEIGQDIGRGVSSALKQRGYAYV